MGERKITLSERDLAAREAANRLRTIDYENAIKAYSIFWAIHNATTDRDTITLKRLLMLDAKPKTKKLAQEFVETAEIACESQLLLPHDCGVDATQLLVSIYEYAVDQNLQTYLTVRQRKLHLIGKNIPNIQDVEAQIENIYYQFKGEKEVDIRNWKDAMKYFYINPSIIYAIT